MFLWSFSVNLQAFYHKCCSLIGCATHYLVMWSICEIIHIWTAARWKWRMIIAVNLIGKKNWKNQGFNEPVTPAILVRCSTNCIVHMSREEWNDVKYIWKNSYLNCGYRCNINHILTSLSKCGRISERNSPFLSNSSSNISKTSASVSSGVLNTEKVMKARGRRPSTFIVSRCLEPLMTHEARVFDMASQMKQ